MKNIIIFNILINILLIGCSTMDLTLEERKWILVEIEGNSAVSAIEGKKPFIEFDLKSSKIGGNATCNNFFADYIIEENKLSIGVVVTTMSICNENSNQEHRFLQALERIDSYKIKDSFLYLYEGDVPILIFLWSK